MLLKTASRAPLYEELLRRGQEERAAQADEAQRQRALEDEERRHERDRRERLADALAGEERTAQAEEVKRGQLMDRRRTPGTPEFAQAQGEAEAQFKRALRPVVGGQTVRLPWSDYAPFLGMEDMPDAEEDGIEFSYDKAKNRAHVRVLDRAGQTLFEQPIDNAAEQLRNWGVEVKEPEVETDLDRLEKKARRVKAEKTLAGEDGAAGSGGPSEGKQGFWRNPSGEMIPVTGITKPDGTFVVRDSDGRETPISRQHQSLFTEMSHAEVDKRRNDYSDVLGRKFAVAAKEAKLDDDLAASLQAEFSKAWRRKAGKSMEPEDPGLVLDALDDALIAVRQTNPDALDEDQYKTLGRILQR